MSAERVLSRQESGILSLTLNRPEKRNAIDSGMVEALLTQLERAELDSGVRVVAVRGAGQDFCAGADLDELLASVDRSVEENAASARRLGEVFLRMRALPKPVVAVVHGRAIAGGSGLATACDLVLARSDSQFGYPEVRRGFVPAMVMAMLRRIVGEKVAFDLVATGRLLSADEAGQLGLVSRVITTDVFEREVGEVLAGLAKSSPTAMALIKRQLYELDGRSFSEGIQLGADVNALARTTPDFRSAIAAFLKRPGA
jgi:methylglutaconyl-CoA hydratase